MNHDLTPTSLGRGGDDGALSRRTSVSLEVVTSRRSGRAGGSGSGGGGGDGMGSARPPRCERDPSHGPTWLLMAPCLLNLGNRTLQSALRSQLSADDGSPYGSRRCEPVRARKLPSAAEQSAAHVGRQRSMPGAKSQRVVEESWHLARVPAVISSPFLGVFAVTAEGFLLRR
jgi:hypothetical protein